MEKIRVLKFGGTSLGSVERFREVVKIIKQGTLDKVVVVSAVAGITNILLELARETKHAKRLEIVGIVRKVHENICTGLSVPLSICANDLLELEQFATRSPGKKISKRTMDYSVSFGERLSASILAAYLSQVGIPAKAYAAWEIGMITNDRFGGADPLHSSLVRIKKSLRNVLELPIVTGYIGKTKSGEIITLGRGGSDYTAAIIAAALDAEEIQIWKDVDGFLTTDPRIVKAARIIPELAFEEACELAYFGAKVIHPKALLPAMRKKIPVRILNTFKPQGKGTLIVSSFERRKATSKTIDALAVRKSITLVRIFSPEFFDGNKMIADVFDLFADHDVNIGDIALSVASISIVMDGAEMFPRDVLTKLKKMGNVVIEKNKAMICAVGGSRNTAAIAGQMFVALGKKKIPVEFIAQASSGYSITFVVDEKDSENTIKILHREYIEKA